MTLPAVAELFAPRRARGLLAASIVGALAVGCADDSAGPDLTGAAAEGEALATQLGCAGCHGGVDGVATVGPSWVGAWGDEVTLDDGSVVRFDEEYVRTAVRTPDAQRREGDWLRMPTFTEAQVSEAELAALVAYLEALGDA